MSHAEKPFDRLVEVMTRLRAPGGCPWDAEQTHESLLRYLVEESYEVVDTIEGGRFDELCEELGDLLLQVVFHAELAREAGRFDIEDVARSIVEKLVRRHPHVFGGETAETAADVENRWERIKAAEKAEQGKPRGALSGVPKHLPALMKARRLTEKAGRVGFDWPDAESVLKKMREELGEVEGAVASGDAEAVKEEFGDLLFVLANLGRHLGVDAEAALQQANAKFVRRFGHVEDRLAEQGREASETSLGDLDLLWEEAKRLEREAPPAS